MQRGKGEMQQRPTLMPSADGMMPQTCPLIRPHIGSAQDSELPVMMRVMVCIMHGISSTV